jgi:uncharacterized protein (TIGR03437 family)
MFKLNALLWLVVLSLLNAETVTVRSGNGSVGGRDSSVTFLVGPANGDFGKAFAPADFSGAQNGPAAYILSRNPLWIAALSSDPSAKWIGTNSSAASFQGNTALYAVKLTITSPFTSAVLTLHYAVDDALGGQNNAQQPNPGVYLNGAAICGNLISNDATDFTQEHMLNCNDAGSQLLVGTNWLYIDAVNLAGSGGLLFSATVNAVNVTVPSINLGGIVNNASSAKGAVAPGSLASVYGSYPVNPAVQASSVPFPVDLDGLSMQFGGIQAPLLYASSGLVNLQVPWELAGQSQVDVIPSANGQTGPSFALSLATFAPGIFSTNGQGTGQGAILDGSYKIVDASNPAVVGNTIVQIYCTGLGPVTNQPATGSPALGDPLSETTTIPVVTVGGIQALVSFSGLTPGGVGLYQVNALVPKGTGVGSSVAVTITIGGAMSNTVTIGVAAPNGIPIISSLSPSSGAIGTTTLALTVNGSGFIPSSSITFNGVSHPTSFVNASQLRTTLTASDLASPGTFAVIVDNPPPGGGASNSALFTVNGPPTASLTGTWTGAWGSIPVPSAYGPLSATLTQTGTGVTGTVTLTDSPCFTVGSVSGSITGDTVSFNGSFPVQQQVAFSATLDSSANSLTGTYEVSTGACLGDFGVFTAKKQ